MEVNEAKVDGMVLALLYLTTVINAAGSGRPSGQLLISRLLGLWHLAEPLTQVPWATLDLPPPDQNHPRGPLG